MLINSSMGSRITRADMGARLVSLRDSPFVCRTLQECMRRYVVRTRHCASFLHFRILRTNYGVVMCADMEARLVSLRIVVYTVPLG
jgi:hypothetical protein